MHDRTAVALPSRLFTRTMLLAVATGTLVACGSTDERIQRTFTSPGKYHVYDCERLQNVSVSLEARIKELETLAAKARQDTGGGLVSALTYEPDIFTARGDIAEVKREQAAQRCPTPPDKK